MLAFYLRHGIRKQQEIAHNTISSCVSKTFKRDFYTEKWPVLSSLQREGRKEKLKLGTIAKECVD